MDAHSAVSTEFCSSRCITLANRSEFSLSCSPKSSTLLSKFLLAVKTSAKDGLGSVANFLVGGSFVGVEFCGLLMPGVPVSPLIGFDVSIEIAASAFVVWFGCASISFAWLSGVYRGSYLCTGRLAGFVALPLGVLSGGKSLSLKVDIVLLHLVCFQEVGKSKYMSVKSFFLSEEVSLRRVFGSSERSLKSCLCPVRHLAGTLLCKTFLSNSFTSFSI